MTLFLSKMTLTRDPSVQALTALLDPKERGRAMDAHHRLIWSVFAGEADATRDFLWRHDAGETFYTLSSRPPVTSPFFDRIDVKPFDPALRPGDRLAFILRANATRSLAVAWPGDGSRPRGKRVDVVVDMMKRSGPEGANRAAVAQQAGAAWMSQQGTTKGFTPDSVTVAHYGSYVIPDTGKTRKNQAVLGVLDMTGTIVVTDPEAFLQSYAQGFGRGKAFGCGMMMVRRA